MPSTDPTIRAAAWRRQNARRAKGDIALRLLLGWVTCPVEDRGRYLKALGKAGRLMIAQGCVVPPRERLERDIESVMVRARKDKGVGEI